LKIILRNLNIPYTQNEQNEWVVTKAEQEKIAFHQRIIGKTTVPNVIGMSAKDAVYLIENIGMHVIIRGVGSVKSQTIPAGSQAYKGGLIELILE
jgi:cell division protein FtsI (penicillin-binding protein 3)